MILSGRFVDPNGNPLSNVNMDFYTTSDTSGTPAQSYQSGSDGTYSVSSSVLDSPTAIVDVQYPGYYENGGSPGLFQGTVTLTPMSIVTTVSKIPWWVWLVLALGLFLLYQNRHHLKKYL